MGDISAETISRIADLALQGIEIKSKDGQEFALVPNGVTLRKLDPIAPPLKDYIEQTVVLDDKDSFVSYVNLFKTADTRIFHTDKSFTAIIDYHMAGKDGGETNVSVGSEPGRTRHVARYDLKHSPEWDAWTDIARNRQPQREFAEFIEEHAKDITKPDNATLLEVASNLQISRKVDFVSGTNTRNGTVQFAYVEEDTTSGGKKGNVEVPAKITLGIPVYKGDPLDQIEVLFRHRLDSGKLFFVIKFLDIETIKDRALKAIADSITAEVDIKPFWGRAGS
jgi:uncharacterized protein YfdQ (DUF2303 family)